MLTFNLFQHKDEPGLYCAVPEDRPVPAFLTGDEWGYADTMDAKALSGFDATVASASAKASGFYLFHSKP